MRSGRRLILTIAAGSGAFLIAVSLVNERTPSQLNVDYPEDSATFEAERSSEKTGSARARGQLESREIGAAEPVEDVDNPANAASSGESAQQEAVALPIGSNGSAIENAQAPAFDLNGMEQNFASESRDPAWSNGMEGRILDEISQMSGLAANLIEVDCRTTHCRLRVTLPTIPTVSQPELVTLSDDGPRFVVGEQVGLETEFVLFLRSEPGLGVFLTYLRRPETSTVQSISAGSPSV